MKIIIISDKGFKDYNYMETKIVQASRRLKSLGYDTRKENLELIVNKNSYNLYEMARAFGEKFSIPVTESEYDYIRLVSDEEYDYVISVINNLDDMEYLETNNSDDSKCLSTSENKLIGIVFWSGVGENMRNLINSISLTNARLYLYKYREQPYSQDIKLY